MAGCICGSRGTMFLLYGLLLFLSCSSNTSINAMDAEYQYQRPLESKSPGKMIKKVAIVGAGAGGSSAAYHLRKFANASGMNVEIDIYEKSDYIGGRSTTVDLYDLPIQRKVELGASIFVKVNTILVDAMEEFGLLATNRSDHDENEVMGVWDGDKFVLIVKDTDSTWWQLTKLFWKYGLAPYKTDRLMRSTIGAFRKLYEPPFFPFKSLSSRVHDLGLVNFTAVTGEELLKAKGISEAFSHDVIQASTRVNYASNLDRIHGLETLVCMAIEGQMQVAGGNWKIFSSMVNVSAATQYLSTVVDTVGKASNGKYVLSATAIKEGAKSKAISKEYDTVVLATPFQFSNIQLDTSLAAKVPELIPYVTLHVTLFTTPLKLSANYFNIPAGTPVPETVLTTLPPPEESKDDSSIVGKAGFFSISTLRQTFHPTIKRNEWLYKIFSPEPMTSELLGKLFDTELSGPAATLPLTSNNTISWIHLKTWQSYPYELPRITFEDPILASGLYYTSGMESFISTMETMALMGKNVAQLIVDDFELRGEEGEESSAEASGVLETEPLLSGHAESMTVQEEQLGL